LFCNCPDADSRAQRPVLRLIILPIQEGLKKMGKETQTKLIIFGVIAIVGILVYAVFFKGVSQSIVSGGGDVASGVNNIVTSATTLSLTGYDSQATGTVVGATSYVGIADQPLATGVTSVSQGNALTILLVNNSNYHNAFFKKTVPATTTLSVATGMNKNASLTIAVYNTAKAAMDNNGGATNQTVSTGSAPTMELDLTGTSQASTQDMVCILEGSDTSKINKLELNGFGASFIGTAKPASYTLAGATSGVWVYNVPAISDASLRVGSIYAESKTGQDMSGAYFKLVCITKEYFLDSYATATTVNAFASKVGEPNVFYGIEDSQGTAKNMGRYAFTGYFQ